MAVTKKDRMAPGFPFPVYVNETSTNQKIAPGVYVDEQSTQAAAATNTGQFLIMFQQ